MREQHAIKDGFGGCPVRLMVEVRFFNTELSLLFVLSCHWLITTFILLKEVLKC